MVRTKTEAGTLNFLSTMGCVLPGQCCVAHLSIEAGLEVQGSHNQRRHLLVLGLSSGDDVFGRGHLHFQLAPAHLSITVNLDP